MKRKNVFFDGAERKVMGHAYHNVTASVYVHPTYAGKDVDKKGRTGDDGN